MKVEGVAVLTIRVPVSVGVEQNAGIAWTVMKLKEQAEGWVSDLADRMPGARRLSMQGTVAVEDMRILEGS